MISQAKRDRARQQRVSATPFEQTFWQAVRNHRFAGFKFRRQQVIGPFIVDFVCLSEKLVVELDGSQHA
jgi:very-short-patch-repair endonuclease